ncbi:MAG: ankyrin repeat domain-containing protein [Rhizobiaceae bacterium]|nr:ankyrin repeat domain-containing protein [Rhizobiaceae bacterium]
MAIGIFRRGAIVLTTTAALLAAGPALAGEHELLAALGAGDLAAMRAELEGGADPNGIENPPAMATWLPVYHAAEAGRADMLALLVEFGADIDRRDRNGDRGLDWASRYGEMPVVALLVGAGATPDPREVDLDVNVPLVEAANGGHVDVANFLLDSGANPNRGSRHDGTPLHEAARLGDPALAARLIAMGADPAAREDMTFKTPLHNAARWGRADAVRLLIEAGAPLDARDWDGQTPLWVAAWLGKHEIVELLMEAGAAVDIPDEEGRSPIVVAMTRRPAPDWEKAIDDPFVSTRDLVLARDALEGRDYEATLRLLAPRTNDLDTALAEAVWGGWEEAAGTLIGRGALVHGRALDGRATLAGSFFYPGLSMFDRLVAANVDLGLAGSETIVAAAAAGRMDIPKALFARRWRVDSPDGTGRTALMAAATEGRVAIVPELLALGADPALRDNAGRGVADHMKARLADLIGFALERECARAYLPTDFIRAEAARLYAAYEQMLPALGLSELAGKLMPAETERNC